MSKYLFVKAESGAWTINALCRVLGVSRSGYYQWRAAEPRAAPAWQPAAQQAFSRHAWRYGTRRLRAGLQAEGYQGGRYALRSWLRASEQRVLSTRPQRPRTTQPDPAAIVAQNRLLGQPAPTRPNQDGSATSRNCRWSAGAGITWPRGAMPARGGWWAGTWPRRYLPN